MLIGNFYENWYALSTLLKEGFKLIFDSQEREGVKLCNKLRCATDGEGCPNISQGKIMNNSQEKYFWLSCLYHCE